MIALGALGAAVVLVAAAAGSPPSPAAVHLAVKGDWGHATAEQAAVSRRICALHRRVGFAAVISTGDNFSNPPGVATRQNFDEPEACILEAGLGYLPAWGNHDLAGSGTADALDAPGRWYAVDRGPARIIVLDANSPENPEQLAFLAEEMSGERPGRARIVAFHQPLASAGYHRPDPRQVRLWEPLLRAGGVRLVLQGHNHHYERIERGGLTFVTTGGGGAPVYPCVRRTEGLRVCRVIHHLVTLRVTPRAIGLRAIAADGSEIDRAHIRVPSS